MKKRGRRLLSWVALVTFVTTCAISGLALPVSAESTGIIVNGDFEQGASVSWRSNAYVMAGVGKDGSMGVKIESTVLEGDSSKVPGIYYKEDFNALLKPNTTYLFSFDYKHEGKGQPHFDVVYSGTDWTGGWTDTDLTPNVGWTTKTIEFTTGAAENMNPNKGWEWQARIVHHANAANYGTGTVWYDNFNIIEKPAPKPATSIELDKTTATIMEGSSFTLTATSQPEYSELPEITWTSGNEAVATVKDGRVTGVAPGSTTITAKAESLPAVSCVVTVVEQPAEIPMELPNGDFNAATSGWVYASGGAAVPVSTDSQDGNKYIVIPSGGGLITAPTITYDVHKNDWFRISFRVRKNAAGKMRFGMRLTGGIFDGYAQPDWTISAAEGRTNNDGEWVTYTAYVRAGEDTPSFKVNFLLIAANSTTGLTLDLDDVSVTKIRVHSEDELNLLYNGTMDAVSAELNDYNYEGLFKDGGKIEVDPTNASNKVLHLTEPAQAYFLPNFRVIQDSTNAKVNLRYNKNMMYKLTYRQRGTGTTSPNVTAGYSTILSVEGEPGVASDEWKTITVYLKTASSINANFLFDFKTTGDVYLDDMSLHEVSAATSLKLEQTAATLLPAQTLALSAVTTPPGVSVQWSSSNDAVATVDQNGKVTAVSDGTATITATCGELTATCTITVKDPGEATAITLDKKELFLVKGKSDTLSILVEPAASRYTTLTWKSSNTAIATVDQNGVVTAANTAGTAVITATATTSKATLTATCVVTVMTEATKLTLSEQKLTLAPPAGKNYQMFHTLAVGTEPANSYAGTLTWKSSDDTIATVDQNGKVSGVAVGTATITVSNGTLEASCTVEVSAAGERMPGGTFDTPDWNSDTWTGWLIKDGNASVVVDPANANNKVLALLKNDEAQSALWLSRMVINPGKTYALSFDIKGDSDAKQLAMYFQASSTSLSGWKYYTVSADWTTVTIRFSTNSLDDGTSAALNRNYVFGFDNVKGGTIYMDNVSLVELPDADQLILQPSGTLELVPQATSTLTLKTEPADASTGVLTWSSSAPTIVSVNQQGVVTAIASSGAATITVANDKGKSCSITVKIDEYANLFQNNGFEQGGLYWSSSEVIKEGIGKDGSAGMQLIHDKVTGERTTIYYKSALQLKPATTYLFSVDYLATAECAFRFWSYDFGLRNPTYEEGNGKVWRTASITFTTPADMTLNTGWDFGIVCDYTGVAPAVIDNLVLKKYTSGVAPQSVTMSQEAVTLIPGHTEALTAHGTPNNADMNDCVWTSSDENIVTVEYGVITGVGKGTATVTCTTKNGKKATCTVTVAGDPALIKNGTFDIAGDTSWTVGTGAEIAAGKGVADSKAAMVTKGSAISQSFSGLKRNTTYTLILRYYSLSGTAKVKLTNGSTALVEKTTGNNLAWTTLSYEFKTGSRVNTTSTLELSTTAQGPIYFDNIILAEKASLIDLEASSVVWGGGNEQVTPGTELTLAVTVTNRGSDRVAVGESFMVEICKNGEVIRTMEFVCTDREELMEDATVIIVSEDKWVAEEGEYVISARVNPDQRILEMNTMNNTAQACLRVSNNIYEVPEIASQAGMNNLVFSDDFNNYSSIDRYATGKDGFKWYVNRQWSGSTITPNDYTIKDGVIKLHAADPKYNITLSTMDPTTGVGFTYRMGYMEIRLRVTNPSADPDKEGATGGIPAVWGFPDNKWLEKAGDNTRWVEMDWMEYWGNGTKYPKYPDGYFTTTFHDQISGEGSNDHWYSNGRNAYKNGLGDGKWHTMGWLWANDLIVGYLDGVEYIRQTYDIEEFPDPMMTVQSGAPVEGAFSQMNYQYAVLFLGGAIDNPMEVDYVQIWQGGDGVINTSGVVIQVDAGKFWYNYCTDDWAEPIHKVTAENKKNVLNGEEIWNKINAQHRSEINAYLTSSGQPNFEVLLEQAHAIKDNEPAPEPEPDDEPKAGDLNGDGKVTVTDMLSLKAHLLGKSKLTGKAAKAADTNKSGTITITDFIQIKAHILGKNVLK